MFIRTWRQWQHGIAAVARRNALRGGKPARPSSFRPQLEALEERAVPSVSPTVGDVFYIDMENHNLVQPTGLSTTPEQLQGNPAAPYLNSLMTPGNPNAAQTSWATNYLNAAPGIHPSEPNYVWQEAGLTGPLNDADPYPNNIVNAPNLSALLQNAGIPWKSYQEDIDLTPTSGSVNQPGPNSLTSTVAPQSQWTVPLKSFSGTSPDYTNAYNGSHQYNFATKHDGQLFFTATNGGNDLTPSNPEAKYYAPLQQLQTDLNNNTVARYNLITPDQYNDMHSSLNTDFTYNGVTYAHNTDQESIALGDNFLSKIIPQIEASQAYKNNGAIVIWFDETEGGDTAAYKLAEIVISPLAKGNAYASPVEYTHSSDLKSMQELFGVAAPGGGFLGDANTPGTNDLSDLFKPNALNTATIQGTVFKSPGALHNGKGGLAGQTVYLNGTNDLGQKVALVTTTAGDGSYSFSDLVPGKYTLTVGQPSSQPQIRNLKVTGGETLPGEDLFVRGAGGSKGSGGSKGYKAELDEIFSSFRDFFSKY